MGDALFAGSCSGVFFAFDKDDGDVRWAYDTSGDGQAASFHGDPVVTDELILVGSDVVMEEEATEPPWGYLYAFELKTGKVRWKFGTPGGVPADLIRIKNSVYAVANDGSLICLNVKDGKVRWRIEVETEVQTHAPRYSPLLFDDRIVFSGPDGSLTAVDPKTGKKLWASQLYGEVNTTLVRAGDDLFAATEMEMIYRVDSKTGVVKAELPAPGLPFGTPIVLEDSLLVLIEGGSFARIGIDDGRVLWDHAIEEEWTSFRPLLWNDRVLVGSGDGRLMSLNIEDGKPGVTYRVEGAVRGFSLDENLLYIGTLGGMLYAHRK